MDLGELTTRYRCVYGDFVSWDQVLADMLADPYDAETLRLLVGELREHGRFRQPVALGTYEEWDYPTPNDEDDVLLASYPAVLDGTHRVCAHMLLGVNDVFVVDEDATPEGEQSYIGGFATDEHDPTYYLVMNTYLDVPLPFAAVAPARAVAKGVEDEREADLDLWEALVSLRIDDDVWLTSPTSGSSRADGWLHYSIAWDAAAFRVTPDVISVCVLEKLTRFGYEVQDFTIRTVLEDLSGDKPVVVDPAVALASLHFSA